MAGLEIANTINLLNHPDDVDIFNRSIYVLGSEFIVLGAGFVVFGVLTMLTLKHNFKTFYTENFWSLVLATLLLSIPLLLCLGCRLRDLRAPSSYRHALCLEDSAKSFGCLPLNIVAPCWTFDPFAYRAW